MKVLQIHGTDTGAGGGPIAMLRLQEGIRKAGGHSRILCMNPTRADSVGIPRVRGEGRLRGLTSRLGFNELHCLGSFRIPRLAAYVEADLLHIHGIHGGFFNYLALPLLTKPKPAVYTLHDMWPFTGHCVHSFDCERWKTGCGNCPYPDLPNPVRRDATSWEWRLKQWSYCRSNLTIVTPSTWIHELAQQSMFQHFQIQHIPHGVDTDMYQPLDREMSRAALGIPVKKKVLLFIVRRMNAAGKNFYMKGADLLVRALQDLPASLRRELVLLLIGKYGEAFAQEVDIDVLPLGFVASDRLKVLAYSAADLFVFPSRAENLPLVLIETMACGTPAVSFRVGGIPDLVRHGLTGFLAEPEDSKQLSVGITQLLEDGHLRAHLSRQCREIAVKEYSLELYVNRHLALYRQVLESASA